MSSAAKRTAQTIAAVLRKTRPAIPRVGDKSRAVRRPAESVSVIPDERVRTTKLVEVRTLHIRPRVDHQLQRVDARSRDDELARDFAGSVLVPCVHDVSPGGNAAQGEMSVIIGLRR